MALSKRDKEFRLTRITYVDFKHLEMDRVLTAFFARLYHDGYTSRINRKFELTTEAFVEEFLEHPEWFQGFNKYPEVLARWVETHLMDVVNRGKATQAIASPRPLHGYTYRFRNPKHSRDYGAAQHLYELLNHARSGSGQNALEHLKSFFFPDQDPVTGNTVASSTTDVETQALLRFLEQVNDAPDQRQREGFKPLCIGSADLLAEDIQRLLFYRNFIPRTVMVDYLKTLIGFHLALYHLRLMKLLPALIKKKGGDSTCASCPMEPRNQKSPQGDCPYKIGLFLDLTGNPESGPAKLAEHSADIHYRRVPVFVKAYITAKKLDEFSQSLIKKGKINRPDSGSFSVGELAQFLQSLHNSERSMFFGQRVSALIQDSQENAQADLDPEIQAIIDLVLPEDESYIEMLVAVMGKGHKRYITECLDSLMMKNRPGAMLAQQRSRKSPRRFVLDSRLLEVLLQIAVLYPGGVKGYHTGEMLIDDLLGFLRKRYGLYIDRLPAGDGFMSPNINDRQSLKENEVAFRERLREVGFYQDLSDAYVTQTVTPRYKIDAGLETPIVGGEE
ncbi:methylation-associated defense system protein MAD7 [Vibrio owensii]|uniref:methylation-associated defense system protein MAD7 n=1 Tax=Vibrio owensii TaxID=696485 RepID=UPI004067D534